MNKLDFNQSWMFRKENDRFVEVDLPHDAMILEERDPDCRNGRTTGYYPGGKYEYRKTFSFQKEWIGKKIIIEFEGIYQNAKVYLNENLIKTQHYGYTGFFLDLSDLLQEDNELHIMVDNSGEPSSRWYCGSGMYRPVWLYVMEKEDVLPEEVHILTLSHDPAFIQVDIDRDENFPIEIFDPQGKRFFSSHGNHLRIELPDALLWSAEEPELYCCKVKETKIPFGVCHIEWSTQGLFINGKETKLRGACIHHDNGILGAKEYADAAERRVRILKEAGFNAIRSAHNPLSKAMLKACDEQGLYVMDEFTDMWYEHKNRYDYATWFEEDYVDDLTAMVRKDDHHPSVIMYSIGNEVTETSQQDGIEYAEMMTKLIHDLDPSRPVTCGINMSLNTMYFAGMGVYQPEADEAPKKERAKNPKAMALLMEQMKAHGITQQNNKESDHTKVTQQALGVDAASGTKADGKLVGSEMFNKMMVTMKQQQREVVKQPLAKLLSEDAYAKLDIAGYNYADGRYLLDKKEYPERVSVGSESLPQMLAQNWNLIQQCPYVVGDFIWTGWDYIGEAGVGTFCYDSIGSKDKEYPTLLAGCGVIDITGHKRPEVMMNRIIYGLDRGPYIGVEPLIHAQEDHLISAWRYSDAVRSWSWKGYEGIIAEVIVYADAKSIALYLNDGFIEEAKVNDYQAKFHLPYSAGILKVIAYDENHQEIGYDTLISANDTKQIHISVSKETLHAGSQDLSYIDIAITDDQGIIHTESEEMLEIHVEGPGILLGFGNADPYDMLPYTGTVHSTYYGRAQAVLKASQENGDIRIRIQTDGLSSETILHVK